MIPIPQKITWSATISRDDFDRVQLWIRGAADLIEGLNRQVAELEMKLSEATASSQIISEHSLKRIADLEARVQYLTHENQRLEWMLSPKASCTVENLSKGTFDVTVDACHAVTNQQLGAQAKADSEAKPFKLEVGKRYVRRDGSITGVIRHRWPGDVYSFYDPDNIESYTANGKYYVDPVDTPLDLIREYDPAVDGEVCDE